MSDGIPRFADFTGSSEPIAFAVHGEKYTAVDDLPLGIVGSLTAFGKGDKDDHDRYLRQALAAFKALLEPESFERFEHAVRGTGPDGRVTIGISRLQKIIPWLTEQYGLRPTQASSGSGNTSSENGASLTVGASPEVSTFSTSTLSGA